MTRYIIIATAVAFCAGLVWFGYDMGRDRANAAHSAAMAEAQAEQLQQTKRMMRDVDTLAEDYQDRLSALAADRSAAAAAVRGLRQALAARASGDSATASGGDGGPVARALEQCAERYSELASIADGYANQLIALQGWAGVVAPRE